MRLARSPAWTVGKYEELPAKEKLLQDSKAALETLKALRQAPIVDEEYRGPVLFEADAADDVVAGLIGGNVLGRKPQLGAPNRTNGGFATSYKSRVLPTFIDVIDDPTMKEFQGKSVVGSYDVDSEGVRSQAVNIIDKGVMMNYLLGRQPIRDFPASNGHGRAAPATPPGPNLGVLLLKSSEPKSLEDLKKAMLDRVSNQGQKFGYRVVTHGRFGAAAAVSCVCKGWARRAGARGCVQRIGHSRAAKRFERGGKRSAGEQPRWLAWRLP